MKSPRPTPYEENSWFHLVLKKNVIFSFMFLAFQGLGLDNMNVNKTLDCSFQEQKAARFLNILSR